MRHPNRERILFRVFLEILEKSKEHLQMHLNTGYELEKFNKHNLRYGSFQNGSRATGTELNVAGDWCNPDDFANGRFLHRERSGSCYTRDIRPRDRSDSHDAAGGSAAGSAQ